MGHKHLLKGLLASASLILAGGSANAAPSIAYPLMKGTSADLYLANPDGSGQVLLYSTAARTNITLLDMNPQANQLAIVESGAKGFKVINYSSTGALQTVTPVNDGCQTEGIDFHPTDGSLLVSEYCEAQDVQQIRRWTSSGFDNAPLMTFGSGHDVGLGRVRWLGDGSGFLINVLQSYGTTLHRTIQRHMMGSLSSSVPVVELSPSDNGDFDTARCGQGSTGSCMAMVYDDGGGQIHKVRFDSTGAYEDSSQAGGSPHFSPNNSQLLYRLKLRPNMLLKVDSFPLVPNGNVGPSVDWRP